MIRRFARKISGANSPLWLAIVRWLVFLGVCGVLVCALTFFALYQLIRIPDANADFQAQTTKVYYSDGKHVLGSFATQDREVIGLDEVPASMQAAAIAAEDRSFYSNRGIDVKGIVRALRNNATTDSVQGGSTITQQYVKILYLNQDRTLKRKVKEAVLSIKVHNKLSKDEVLSGYLNTIYFGNGAYGVQVASQTYFGHDAKKLTIPESAVLAAIINNPSYYDPFSENGKDNIMKRYNYVLSGMANAGAITQDELEKHTDNLPDFAKHKRDDRFGGNKGHLLQLVRKKMIAKKFTDSQVNGGGLKIVTTFDYKGQKAAVQAVEDTRPDGLKALHPALVSIEPGSGAVRAMYGGPNYVKSQQNWALLGSQPGSAFKAFGVIAALDNGYSLNTMLHGNSPLNVAGGYVENQGNRSYGQVPLLTATEDSINTAFVDLALQMKNGPEKIKQAALDAGIPKNVMEDVEAVPSVALGVTPVPTIDMADAFATIAASGKRSPWYVVESVEDAAGNELYEHETKSQQAFPKDVASDTIEALEAVVRSGTGTNARTQCPTAGKTGTATFGDGPDQYVSSSWFVGFSPKLATAVMYARGNGHERLDGYLPSFFGGDYPAMTFRSYMTQALDGSNCGSFPSPANISSTEGQTYQPPAVRCEQGEHLNQSGTACVPNPAPTQEPSPEPTQEPSPTPSPTKSSPDSDGDNGGNDGDDGDNGGDGPGGGPSEGPDSNSGPDSRLMPD